MENPRVVVEMSRWLLDQLTVGKGSSGYRLIHEAFEACGTREEFEDFLKIHTGDVEIDGLRSAWADLQESTPPPVHRHRQVVLPDF